MRIACGSVATVLPLVAILHRMTLVVTQLCVMELISLAMQTSMRSHLRPGKDLNPGHLYGWVAFDRRSTGAQYLGRQQCLRLLGVSTNLLGLGTSVSQFCAVRVALPLCAWDISKAMSNVSDGLALGHLFCDTYPVASKPVVAQLTAPQ